MEFTNIIESIESNYFSMLHEMKNFLLRITEALIRDPETCRVLKKDIIRDKILVLRGGREMLLLMGFRENHDSFIFPPEALIEKLENVREALLNWNPAGQPAVDIEGPSSLRSRPEVGRVMPKPVPLPNLIHKYANPFLRKITETFHRALIYKDTELLDRAREMIPIKHLEVISREKMDLGTIRKGTSISADDNISMQELFLMSMLDWFKEKFFEWVDTPSCDYCYSNTEFYGLCNGNDPDWNTKRKELYRCQVCKKICAFQRVNDLSILLETKAGRCGEWANVFTLMCHAMGWEARLVVDETDHVWTEVFSPNQNRWLHCDPCENVIDTPLMYEHGWKKKLTYVMAYSPNDIQDVSRRYTSDPTSLYERRTECTEQELTEAIVHLRNERLKNKSEDRQTCLLKRTLSELAELMLEEKPEPSEMSGRLSGSLVWRKARGETGEVDWVTTTFGLFNTQLNSKRYGIKYSCALDRYETEGEGCITIDRWSRGIYKQDHIMRKVEYDWDQVYLCRREGTDEGYIAWRIAIRESNKVIDTLSLKLERETFGTGNVLVEISGDSGPKVSLNEGTRIAPRAFRGSRLLLIECYLSGGSTDLGWQQAQLFRQTIDSKEYPFEIYLTFDLPVCRCDNRN